MDQPTSNDLMMILAGFGGLAFVLFLIPFIIFCLWLYFGFGTLTRLTDIKDLLEDIRNTLENNNSSSQSHVVYDAPVFTPAAQQSNVSPEESSGIEANKTSIVGTLKKPSAGFLWLIGTVIVVFISVIIVGLVSNSAYL